MNLFPEKKFGKFLLTALAALLFSAFLSAQTPKKTSFLQLTGTVQVGNKNMGGVQIQVVENGSVTQTVTSKDNGTFLVVLDLGKDYILLYSKPGYVSKSIEARTQVPPDAADIGYTFKCNVDLIEDIGDISKADPMSKPIAKIAYNTTYEDFDYDANYTRRIKQEQDQALRDAAAAKRDLDKARLDSLNKIWSDSIARAKEREGLFASERAAADKARQDSIMKAQAAAGMYAAAERARIDSLQRAEVERKRQEEIAREKAKQDSLNTAQAELKKKQEEDRLRLIAEAREKARLDSISKADAEAARLASISRQKAMQDSINQANAQAEARKKAEEDSIAKAKADDLARQKAIADSTALAQAQQKSRLDSTAKADAAAAKLAEANRQKSLQDSIANAKAQAEVRKKAEADSIAGAKAAQAEAARLAEANRQKAMLDSINNAKATAEARKKAEADSVARVKADEDARKKALADAAEKSRQDSISKAVAEENRIRTEAENKTRTEAAERARQKALSDSIVKADADAKALALATEKAKSEEASRLQAEELRRYRDSVASADRAIKDKEEAERQARIQAEIQAKKDALAKAAQKDTTVASSGKSTAAVPKIVDSDYQEGITEEKLNEGNRAIYRTVVKKDGITSNYQKIVYTWGGIFYFKNENSMTQTLFDQELSLAKKALNK